MKNLGMESRKRSEIDTSSSGVADRSEGEDISPWKRATGLCLGGDASSAEWSPSAWAGGAIGMVGAGGLPNTNFISSSVYVDGNDDRMQRSRLRSEDNDDTMECKRVCSRNCDEDEDENESDGGSEREDEGGDVMGACSIAMHEVELRSRELLSVIHRAHVLPMQFVVTQRPSSPSEARSSVSSDPNMSLLMALNSSAGGWVPLPPRVHRARTRSVSIAAQVMNNSNMDTVGPEPPDAGLLQNFSKEV